MSSGVTIGSRLGAYEILSVLGEGGMGTVYSARDTRLERGVAIKVLLHEVADNPDRLARFRREAQVLAALNHPHIAHIHGLEEGPAGPFLVLELVEGPTLADRIAAGPVPLDEAVSIARQIAEALEAAHELGIVHRDLKPANIKVRGDGTVKVLDFGLAKALDPASGSVRQAALMNSPTVTSPALMTGAGTILGTASYMSPEQARGKAVDRRSDIWAFGAVLFEMLTGRRPFPGDDVTDVIVSVVGREPDWSALPAGLPPAVKRLLQRCLDKDVTRRLQAIGEARIALADANSSGIESIGDAPRAALVAAPESRTRERLLWALALVLTASAAAWLALGRNTPTVTDEVAHRLILPLPEGVSLDVPVVQPLRLSVSADGRRVAFVGGVSGRPQTLWIQSLVDGNAREVQGTERAFGPEWTADGKRITFVASPSGPTRMVDVDSGAVSELAIPGYAVHSEGNQILASMGSPEWAVRYQASQTAQPVVLFKSSKADEQFLATAFLPDQRFLLWHRLSVPGGRMETAYLNGRPGQTLLEFPDLGRALLANGALVYSRGDRLFAQAVDETSTRVVGEPVVLAAQVDNTGANGLGATFGVSKNGVLVYSGGLDATKAHLVWVDRTGRELSTVGDAEDYSNIELSPDGRRVAVSVTDPQKATRDIYVVDLDRGIRQRLTFDPSDERAAVWSPDGKWIFYNSKGLELYRRPADFTGSEEAILSDQSSKDPRQVSPDGRLLLYRRSGAATGNDVWIVPLDGDRRPTPVLETSFNENYASFSPDARSIVYVSNESGRPEVYVLSREGGGKTQISTGGGTFPRWRRDGRELFYVTPDQTIVGVAVTGSGRSFQAGATTPLFKADLQPGPGVTFDIAPDGQRFLLLARVPSRLPPSLQVVINWPALLKRP